jgi:transmembrane sensor
MVTERQYPDAAELERAKRIAALIAGYIRRNLSVSDHDELDRWVEESDRNMKLFEELTDDNNVDRVEAWIKSLDSDAAWDRVQGRIHHHEKKSNSKNLFWIASAACVAGVGFFIFLQLQHKKIPKANTLSSLEKKDIPPGSNKATLTLADGKKIPLDSNISGNSFVNIKDSTISYVATAGLGYNTLSVPRGGQYHVLLADGTQVWLNAASSLRYPVSFSGNERKVELSGEGYFEVAKDPSKPFHVMARGADIAVLGTHFNVNAYTEEENISTTLLEGSVKVSFNDKAKMISPGEQAIVEGSSIILNRNANIGAAVAWKNGKFAFDEEKIEPLMRQAARWYDINVKYEGDIPDHFNADIGRDVPLSRLLHILELTGRVHFELEGKTIVVKP